MIPRYAPTYRYSDLRWSIRNCQSNEIRKRLSSRLANYYNVKHVFLLDSGKIAIYALLKAYDRYGSVLTPAYNCIEVPRAISDAGYSPVFVDNDIQTLNINDQSIRKAITTDVKVIMPVHLFGVPCEVGEQLIDLQNKSLLLVEDAAPSFGATLNGRLIGRSSDVSILSFHWTKPVSGETGGAILTNNDVLAEKIKKYLETAVTPQNNFSLFVKSIVRKIITDRRIYPITKQVHKLFFGEQMYEVVPHQTTPPERLLRKMSPFDCALILRQIDRLDWNLSRRKRIAQIYLDELSAHKKIRIPSIPEGSSPSWTQFPFLVDEKKKMYKHMQKHGIDITWSYRYACSDTYQMVGFPTAQKIAKSILSLPIYPDLTDKDAYDICAVVNKY